MKLSFLLLLTLFTCYLARILIVKPEMVLGFIVVSVVVLGLVLGKRKIRF
jgi:hypothetical protein